MLNGILSEDFPFLEAAFRARPRFRKKYLGFVVGRGNRRLEVLIVAPKQSRVEKKKSVFKPEKINIPRNEKLYSNSLTLTRIHRLSHPHTSQHESQKQIRGK